METSLADLNRTKVVLESIGITTENKIRELNRQIRALDIPAATSAAELWRWLQSAEAGEAAQAAGKFGPLVLRFIMAMMHMGRGR